MIKPDRARAVASVRTALGVAVAVLAAGTLANLPALAQQARRFMVLDGQQYAPQQLELAARSPVQVAMPRCSSGECEITRARDGHFYVPGYLNGFPVVWMVDTGASHSIVSMEVARNAGIRAGAQAEFSTAAGRSTGAMSGGNDLTVGSIRLRDVTVGMSQKLNVNLLGASALSRFNVTQDSNTMTISRTR